MLLFLIGDTHLGKCYKYAEKVPGNVNFGKNEELIWAIDIQRVKDVEDKFKQLRNSKGVPDAVVVMCGGYDLFLNEQPKDIAFKLRKFAIHVISSGVKYLIVCSIMDKSCSGKHEENLTNSVRQTNRALAKLFCKMKQVAFTNVRPPGKPNDIVDQEDFYHLKVEGYQHIYQRLKATLSEKVFPYLGNVAAKKVNFVNEEKDNRPTPSKTHKPTTASYSKEFSIEKRMDEFKDVLLKDFNRICAEENNLTLQYNSLQESLEAVTKQKNEIATTFKRFFDIDLIANA